MQFNLTFNKPAASMFFAAGATAIKVKVGGKGEVLFKPSDKEGGKDVFPITSRTRGGIGITVGGRFADQFLQETEMDRGVHMALEGSSYKWIAGHAVEGKPSKVVPTARLWRATDESMVKAEDAPKRGRKPGTKVQKAVAPKQAKVAAKAITPRQSNKPKQVEPQAETA
jgi:hypothetical protein